MLAITMIIRRPIRAQRCPAITGYATAGNFSRDNWLWFEIFIDVIIRVALYGLFVPTTVRHAQAMLKLVSPQLQIGRGCMLNVIPCGTTACQDKPRDY